MLDPKDIELGGKTFVLSKFAAVAGREIITQYPTTAMPKVGDYATNEALMLKVMAHVGVRTEDGSVLQLTSRTLVDNHVPDFEVLMRLEWAMMEYNCSFFRDGSLSGLLDRFVKSLPAVISPMLTALQERSSAKGSQRSTN